MNRFALLVGILCLALIVTTGCKKKEASEVPLSEMTQEQILKVAQASQEKGNLGKAIEAYEQLIAKYPEGEHADDAQFMIGFLYANDLKDLDKAREAYTIYLEKYRDKAEQTMIMSAEVELANLGKDPSEMMESFVIEEEGKDKKNVELDPSK